MAALTLIVHGDDDQIMPIDASGRRSVELVRDATMKVYPGARTVCSPPTGPEFTADLLASSGKG